MIPPAQLALNLPHRSATGEADFLVAPSNAEAVAWLDRWPDWPGPALVIHGPPACGKSHLAQVWRARTSAVQLTPEALKPADLPALLFGLALVVEFGSLYLG